MEIMVHLSLEQFVQGSSRVPLGREQHTNLQETGTFKQQLGY